MTMTLFKDQARPPTKLEAVIKLTIKKSKCTGKRKVSVDEEHDFHNRPFGRPEQPPLVLKRQNIVVELRPPEQTASDMSKIAADVSSRPTRRTAVATVTNYEREG